MTVKQFLLKNIDKLCGIVRTQSECFDYDFTICSRYALDDDDDKWEYGNVMQVYRNLLMQSITNSVAYNEIYLSSCLYPIYNNKLIDLSVCGYINNRFIIDIDSINCVYMIDDCYSLSDIIDKNILDILYIFGYDVQES